jgi:hypothetical protein
MLIFLTLESGVFLLTSNLKFLRQIEVSEGQGLCQLKHIDPKTFVFHSKVYLFMFQEKKLDCLMEALSLIM